MNKFPPGTIVKSKGLQDWVGRVIAREPNMLRIAVSGSNVLIHRRSSEVEIVKNYSNLKITKLIERLKSYSNHSNSCHCRDDEDETCTCGYYRLLKEIEAL